VASHSAERRQLLKVAQTRLKGRGKLHARPDMRRRSQLGISLCEVMNRQQVLGISCPTLYKPPTVHMHPCAITQHQMLLCTIEPTTTRESFDATLRDQLVLPGGFG
jgi:hypothetical protein